MSQLKPQPNHARYIEVLRSLTPAQRLAKAFEMGEFTKNLFLTGLRRRFPQTSEVEIMRIYLERLAKCHNRNW